MALVNIYLLINNALQITDITDGDKKRTELHVEVSLSKILNPKTAPDVQLAPCVAASAISKGPAMSWRLIQGVPWPSPIE